MVRVLSFDIGLRNLAFAELDVTDATATRVGAGGRQGIRLRRWGLLNLNPRGKKSCSPEEVLSELVAALDRTFVSHDEASDASSAPPHYDVLLIENQPSRKNPTMKSIQVAVHTFFATLRQYAAPGAADQVRLVSASQKLLCARAPLATAAAPAPADPSAAPAACAEEAEAAVEAPDTDGHAPASRAEKSEYKARKDLSVDLSKLYVPALARCAKPVAPRRAKAAAAKAAAAAAPEAADAPKAPEAPEAPDPTSICAGQDLVGVLAVYRAAKKRDDLCDALMQAVAYAERHMLAPKRPAGGRRRCALASSLPATTPS